MTPTAELVRVLLLVLVFNVALHNSHDMRQRDRLVQSINQSINQNRIF